MTRSDSSNSTAAPRHAAPGRVPPAAWRWLLVGFTVVGFALRAYRLAAQSLWSDEDITLDRSGQALGEMLAALPVEHAPLYFALMRGWTLLVGDGDLALRWPSLAFGVLAIPLVGFVGSRLANRTVGLIGALLMAVNPFLVWYGQEARMYTLVAALALVALAAVLHAEASGRRAWWVVAGAAAALCVYTHYYGALIVLVLAAWCMLDLLRRGRSALPGWAIAGVTAFILFAPWVPRALQVGGFPGWREPVPLARAPWINVSAWSAGLTASPVQATWITWLHLALAVIGVVVLIRAATRGPRRAGAARLLLWGLAPLAAIALLLLRNPDFHPRYFLAVLPSFYLLVASGVPSRPAVLTVGVPVLLVAGAWGPLSNLYHDPAYQKLDYRQIIQSAEAAAGTEDTTLWLDGPPFGMMERYRADESPVKIVNWQSESMRALYQKSLAAQMGARAFPYRHIWLAEDGTANGDGRRWLEQYTYPVEQRGIQHLTLSRYYRPPVTLAQAVESTADGLLNQGEPSTATPAWALPMPDSVSAGDVLPITTMWHPDLTDGASRGPLKISVRLLDSHEQIVASADRPLVAGSCTSCAWHLHDVAVSRQGLLVPEDLEPRKYVVVAVLYDAESLEQIHELDAGEVVVTDGQP